MAQDWWLPEAIYHAIRGHHDATLLDGSDQMVPEVTVHLIAVGQLAEYLLQQTTGESMTAEWRKLGSHCLNALDLTADDLPTLCREASLVIEGLEVI